MSIQAVSFVLDSDVPEVAAKMLLVCLANAHNNETGLCCPSVNRLAEESNMSRRSVQRWLKWLDENGFLQVIEVTSDSGRQQSNSYRLIGFHRGAKLTPLPRVGGDTVDAGEGVTADTLGGDTDGTPLKEPEENQKNEREQASERVSLDEIWKAFPHRPMDGRRAAEEAYAMLSDVETHRVLVAAKRQYRWHIEDSEARGETPDSQLDFRIGMGKWIRTGVWVEALSTPLRIDPVAGKSEELVALDAASPEAKAIERLRGKAIYVGASGKITVTRSELEQARTAA